MQNKTCSVGLNMVAGKTLSTQHGYLSDTDENRAKEIMEMFTNPNYKRDISNAWGFWLCQSVTVFRL